MIPDIPVILAMLVAGKTTLEQAQGWIEKHVELALESAVDEIDMRDAFVLAALPAVLALVRDSQNGWANETVAANCYDLAEAMAVERRRRAPDGESLTDAEFERGRKFGVAQATRVNRLPLKSMQYLVEAGNKVSDANWRGDATLLMRGMLANVPIPRGNDSSEAQG